MDPFIASIVMFGGNFAPRGWALCNGQLLQISSYSALFSLVGTIYGGDGRSTFGLPDLRGRLAIHAGTGPGLTPRVLGQKIGTETETLTTLEMPNHGHDVSVAVNTATGEESSSTLILSSHPAAFNEDPTPGALLGGVNETNVGGSGSHTNMMPCTVVNFLIALEGIYPTRN